MFKWVCLYPYVFLRLFLWLFFLFLFVLSCSDLFLFDFVIIPSMPVCFLKRDRKSVDQDERGMGRNGEEFQEGKLQSEYTAWQKRSIFNIRKKEKTSTMGREVPIPQCLVSGEALAWL